MLHFLLNPFWCSWSPRNKSTELFLFLIKHLMLYGFHGCFSISSFSCPSNWSDKHGQERFLYHGECLENCPVGHYPAKGHTCLPCPDNCELCYNPHICSRCMSGYVIIPPNHTCQKLECRQGETSLGLCSAPGGGMSIWLGLKEALTTLLSNIMVLYEHLECLWIAQ